MERYQDHQRITGLDHRKGWLRQTDVQQQSESAYQSETSGWIWESSCFSVLKEENKWWSVRRSAGIWT